MSGRPSRREHQRQRRIEIAGLVSSLVWLALALAVFRVPLGHMLSPLTKTMGLASLFQTSEPGFVLQMTTIPSEGQLWVDGVDRGTAPVIANIACEEGQEVHLRVTKPGLSAWQRRIACREGQTLVVKARLSR